MNRVSPSKPAVSTKSTAIDPSATHLIGGIGNEDAHDQRCRRRFTCARVWKIDWDSNFVDSWMVASHPCWSKQYESTLTDEALIVALDLRFTPTSARTRRR